MPKTVHRPSSLPAPRPPAAVRVAAALLALSLAPAPARSDTAIPAAFRGVWMRDCADPAAAESWLRLEADHVSFYESAGPVLAAVRRNDTPALIVELSGEGETWLEGMRWRLQPGADGPRLVDGALDQPLSRERCASAQRQP